MKDWIIVSIIVFIIVIGAGIFSYTIIANSWYGRNCDHNESDGDCLCELHYGLDWVYTSTSGIFRSGETYCVNLITKETKPYIDSRRKGK